MSEAASAVAVISTLPGWSRVRNPKRSTTATRDALLVRDTVTSSRVSPIVSTTSTATCGRVQT